MDKTFETLYKIAMLTADTCLTDQSIQARFSKLEEEYQEVIQAFSEFNKANVIVPNKTLGDQVFIDTDKQAELLDEMGDLLFVLLHSAHKMKVDAASLLHKPLMKMIARLNDPNYVAKEQRNG